MEIAIVKEITAHGKETRPILLPREVRRLVDENYPESTTKCIIQRLKQFNLIDFGNQNCKGKSLFFTNLGKTFFEILRGELS